jgi:DNA primase
VSVQWPVDVTEVFIFADNDDAGLKASYEASQRLAMAGLVVRVINPPTMGWDMNDWLLAEGVA